MTQTQPGPDETPSPLNGSNAEPLGHLFKMSPTAGVATTDYASINGIAIAAIILGVASVLCLLSSDFLFLPFGGVVCGIVAFRQIRDSNGTQVGRGLALGGLLLSVLLGAAVAGTQMVRAIRTHGEEQQVAAVVEAFGQNLHAEQYDAAYAQASPRFQARVSPETFRSQAATLNSVSQLGRLQSLRWNGNPMIFERNPDTGEEHCTVMTLESMEKLEEPGRELLGFEKVSGQWLLEEFPRLFPAEPAKKKSVAN
jgi:hypothetical protein